MKRLLLAALLAIIAGPALGAFNGSGTFVRIYDWTDDAANGINISSTRMDDEMDGMATGLSTCITKDGQTTVTANLPMSGFIHTGVGNASARNHYAAVGQIQDQGFVWVGTAGGTANALTLTPSPAITAYATGQSFVFKAGSSNNSGATTVAISGLSTIAVQYNGAALIGGEILANKWYRITLDSTSTAQLEAISTQLPFADSIPAFRGSADNSKQVRIEADGITTATTRVITVPDRDLTLNENIKGTATNDNAAAGFVGEFISSTVASGSAVSLTTATANDVTSIELTAGDWDVWGTVLFSPNAGTTSTALLGGISSTTDTLPTSPEASGFSQWRGSLAGANVPSLSIPTVRVSIASTTTYYLVAQANFSASTNAAYGGIFARRVR